MTKTRLDWPAKPRRSIDPNFGRRQTWRCRTEGYTISRIPDWLPNEYCLIFPKWSGLQPRRFRTLRAAMRAAESHRNEDQ